MLTPSIHIWCGCISQNCWPFFPYPIYLHPKGRNLVPKSSVRNYLPQQPHQCGIWLLQHGPLFWPGIGLFYTQKYFQLLAFFILVKNIPSPASLPMIDLIAGLLWRTSNRRYGLSRVKAKYSREPMTSQSAQTIRYRHIGAQQHCSLIGSSS